ncbi:hypothetical protein Lbir_2427 [Legionella birminghamensis]|uniref:Uncharacterized protein n=1 Tax=Legionella birminghamensis TaxID=28083 RepID=A0A378IM39_9GAMM|nr:hypothetical protein [Legionella birminghamensis]KTC68894.1 hypothetical protein Lbir_2427 [Legionella birminghamensis]STX33164.1 Uncharacterised protein [Legionella birminghamensis]
MAKVDKTYAKENKKIADENLEKLSGGLNIQVIGFKEPKNTSKNKGKKKKSR